MRSIYFKNFMLMVSLVVLGFFSLGTSFMVLGRNYLISEKRSGLSANALAISRTASALLWEDELSGWDMRLILSSVGSSTGNHLFLCDSEGYVVSCSDPEPRCAHIGSRIGEEFLQVIDQRGALDQLTNLGGFYPGTYYVVAVPIHSRLTGQQVGYVFAGSDSSSIINMTSIFISTFFVVAATVMCLAVILSYIGSKRQAKPINQMAAASRRFAHGDFSARVENDDRDDEIGQLTEAFNAMAESLETSEERRREFVANVSHELKTPMTAIAGFADGILDGTVPPELHAQYLSTISAETKRLSRLVRRMLDLSMIQADSALELRKKSFDVSEAMRCVIVNLEHRIREKDLDVDALIPEEPMTVLGDEDSITQVIYNLVDNAVKFANPGSVLGLSVWKNGPKAYVSVKDRGETIPEEDLPVIFDRFHKTDRSRSLNRDGVGLGLYIAKTILNIHDEDIRVTSRDGVTEFVFTLTLKS